MSDKKRERGSNITKWILTIISIIIVTSFVAYSLGKNSQETSPKVDNTQALQTCIKTNVSPLESQAVLAPELYRQGSIEEATSACKTMYPN